MGSVDGNRIWGKEIKGMVLTHVQWSPDAKTILFGNSKGEVHIYDSHGTYNVSYGRLLDTKSKIMVIEIHPTSL